MAAPVSIPPEAEVARQMAEAYAAKVARLTERASRGHKGAIKALPNAQRYLVAWQERYRALGAAS